MVQLLQKYCVTNLPVMVRISAVCLSFWDVLSGSEISGSDPTHDQLRGYTNHSLSNSLTNFSNVCDVGEVIRKTHDRRVICIGDEPKQIILKLFLRHLWSIMAVSGFRLSSLWVNKFERKKKYVASPFFSILQSKQMAAFRRIVFVSAHAHIHFSSPVPRDQSETVDWPICNAGNMFCWTW